MALVIGTEVLLYVGVKTPSELETAWADLCAAAVEEAITVRLNGAVVPDPPTPELRTVAIMAAGEAYKRREAPFGVANFDGQGEAVRLARDYLEAIKPQLDRYGNGPGIG